MAAAASVHLRTPAARVGGADGLEDAFVIGNLSGLPFQTFSLVVKFVLKGRLRSLRAAFTNQCKDHSTVGWPDPSCLGPAMVAGQRLVQFDVKFTLMSCFLCKIKVIS